MNDKKQENNPLVITICREFGAEGHEIGKVLSEKTGIPLYDKDLLEAAAKEIDASIDQAAKIDEKPSKGIISSYLLVHNEIPNDKLFHAESNRIRLLAQEKSCIIVGRLGDYILRDRENTLNVLVYAPFSFREALIQKKRNISKAEATKLVRRMDSTRNSYYDFYTDGKWNHRTGKDLMIDRSAFGIAGCAEMIMTAIELKTI